jgi:hypothetical protein
VCALLGNKYPCINTFKCYFSKFTTRVKCSFKLYASCSYIMMDLSMTLLPNLSMKRSSVNATKDTTKDKSNFRRSGI